MKYNMQVSCANCLSFIIIYLL